MEAIGKDFVEFWDYAAAKGLVKKDWAQTLRSAAKQVLTTVEPDTWEQLDLNTIDLDPFIQRFERLRMSDLKPASMAVYGHRTRLALSAYLDFLRSPSTWQYSAAGHDASNGGALQGKQTKTAGVRKSASAKKAKENTPSQLPAKTEDGIELLSYPYPLRPGLVVTLNLPLDLTKHEAKRLAAYVDSLAVEPQLALPAGGGQ